MSQRDIVDALIEDQGTLFSEAFRADIGKNTPVELFAWLEGTLLLAARIDHKLAIRAGLAMREAGFHKVDNLTPANRESIVECLGDNGYKRYRITTADYLLSTADHVRTEYDGDLRGMVSDDPTAETVLNRIQAAKGIGAVGAEIFARDVQLVWDVFYPRLGEAGAKEARSLGLSDDHGALVAMAGSRERFVRLASALTQAAITRPSEDVEEAAEENG